MLDTWNLELSIGAWSFSVFLLSLLSMATISGNNWNPAQSSALQKLLDDSVSATVTAFEAKHLQADQLAVTLVDLNDPQVIAATSRFIRPVSSNSFTSSRPIAGWRTKKSRTPRNCAAPCAT